MFNCFPDIVCEPHAKMDFQEKSLYQLWLSQSFPQSGLVTTDGQPLSVVSPGRRNLIEGPDFLDAIVLVGGEFRRGAIEIHRHNADWYSHQHHLNPLYNDTILHVVADQSGEPVRLQNQQMIPTLWLPVVAGTPDKEFHPCDKGFNIPFDRLQSELRHYAGLRFQRKCLLLQAALLKKGAEDLLYEKILDVFGYSHNRRPFSALAALIPVTRLYAILDKSDPESRLLTLESLLLGGAGLLKPEIIGRHLPDNQYSAGLLHRWRTLQKKFNLPELSGHQWHFAAIRPANHPTYRIIALAQILTACYPRPLAALWLTQIMLRSDFSTVLEWAQHVFQQPAGMWHNHPLREGLSGRHLIGKGRLMDLLSNVLIPFGWALAAIQKDEVVISRMTHWAEQVPVGEWPRSILRFMGHCGVTARQIEWNYLIQGALEFNRQYCELEICQLCPLERYGE